MKVKFRIGGMSCAACSARVQRAADELPGVTRAEVNLLTGTMTAELNGINPDRVIRAITAAGYTAAVDESTGLAANRDARNLLIRFLVSLVFMIPLFYVGMGYHMGWPIGVLAAHPAAAGWTMFALTLPILAVNYRYFVRGTKAVLHRAPNMDTLVAVGSGVAFLYSCYVAIALSVGSGDGAGLYFESAGMILTLITLGKWLEAAAKGKTTEAIGKMLDLAPKTALRVTESGTERIPVAEVRAGDLLRVFPGESVAVDGTVVSGESAVDESMLSGESLPVDKKPGSSVFAGTVNSTGSFDLRAEKVGADTTLSGIVRLMEEASSSKLPISRVADKVSGIFVPAVVAVALVTLVVWLCVGASFSAALGSAISVLVISCPCALGLATPVAIMVGTGKGAENGILIRSAEALERLRSCKTVVLDKTGTITTGKPRVTDVISLIDESELLRLCASVEERSEHPLGGAVVRFARDRGIELRTAEDFVSETGAGVVGTVNGRRILCGKRAWLEGKGVSFEAVREEAERLAAAGKTPIWAAEGSRLLGGFFLFDTIKTDARQAVETLHRMGLRVVVLTGDNRLTAQAVAAEIGADEVRAEVSPQDKDRIVGEYAGKRGVVMVGDGINDAPALLRADVGIAIGVGADVAIESADIVLQGNGLLELPDAVRLSRATLRNIKQNLFWAFCYNVVAIPIAAGAFSSLGFAMNPMIAAAAMSLSSVCVVLNALRLRLFRASGKRPSNETSCALRGANSSRKDFLESGNQTTDGVPSEKNQGANMKKVLKIEGMMCAHCKAHVENALTALDGVTAEVDLANGIALAEVPSDCTDETLIAAVEKAGYRVAEIRSR